MNDLNDSLTEQSPTGKEKRKMDNTSLLALVAFVVLWIVLNRWILPLFGVSTCMSGCCALDTSAATCKSNDRESPIQKQEINNGQTVEGGNHDN